MTPGQKRAARRAAATVVAAGVTWGFTGLPGKALIRGPLTLLAAAAVGSLTVQARTAAKAYTTEQRLNAHVAACAAAVSFVANGGTVGGIVTFTSDVHVDGNLYGTGGTLSIGDATHVAGGFTADSTITTHTAFRGSTTTGDGLQGAVSNPPTQGQVQSCVNRVNDLLTALG